MPFITSTENGLRGLAPGEYERRNNDADRNIDTSAIEIPSNATSVTVNSLRYSGSDSPTNIGAGKTLIIRSGGLIFAEFGTIGVRGSRFAGTIQFGLENTQTEAVIWSTSPLNVIGATISGTGGLSKAGTGRLLLVGNNIYSGLTYVAAGTLQVGDGVFNSNLGLSEEVTVENGAILSLYNEQAILDTATIRLEQFGVSNGKLYLDADINELIGALYLGDALAAPGSYGSSQSTAIFKDDNFFIGTGVVTVVPEPSCVAFALGGFGVLLSLRRRRL